MFRFPDANAVSFECSLKLCAENEKCKPNCALKIDDPLGEEPELVSKLLRSLPDEDFNSSGHWPTAFLSEQQHKASTLIHVVERRELVPPAVVPTECKSIVV